MSTLPADKLIGMLTDVRRFASTDKTLPELNTVELFGIRHDDRHALVMNATDRYMLAQTWDDCDGALPTTLITLSDVSAILAALQPLIKCSLPVTLTNEHDKLIVECHSYGTQCAVSTLEPIRFPKVARLVRTELTEFGPAMYDPKRLDTLSAVAKRRKERVILATPDTRKGTQIRIGENFRAVVMPYFTKDPLQYPNDPVFERPEPQS